MKKFIEEFKAFALRGNVMDMAIGVIIGGAFTTIVTSLTENLINPILGLAGGTDLSGFVLSLGGIELRYGAFLTSVINFLIMALVLFCLLKAVHRKKARSARRTDHEEVPVLLLRNPDCSRQVRTLRLRPAEGRKIKSYLLDRPSGRFFLCFRLADEQAQHHRALVRRADRNARRH